MIIIDKTIKQQGMADFEAGIKNNPYPQLSENGVSWQDGWNAAAVKKNKSDMHALAKGCQLALLALEGATREFGDQKNHDGVTLVDYLKVTLNALRYLECVEWYGALVCSYDPTDYPGGMHHCPDCGEMVLGGFPHPDWRLIRDCWKMKLSINGFKAKSCRR